VAAAALTLFGTVVLLLVSHAEHVYSLRPSTLINAYLFVSILCDICRTRTLYLIVNNINHTIATVNLTELVVKIMVLLLETVEKRAILQPLYKNEPPESTSGILNRSLFWWLWSLLRNGSRGMLSMDSLSSLDEDLISETLHGKFRLSWNQGVLACSII
jgi:ATP-binding cassette, subfamily C (CFTR/MRP), member 1